MRNLGLALLIKEFNYDILEIVDILAIFITVMETHV